MTDIEDTLGPNPLHRVFRCQKFIGRENTHTKIKDVLLKNFHRYPYGTWYITKHNENGDIAYEVWVETCKSNFLGTPNMGPDTKVYSNQDIKDELNKRGIALKSWEMGDEPIPSPYRKKAKSKKPKRCVCIKKK